MNTEDTWYSHSDITYNKLQLNDKECSTKKSIMKLQSNMKVCSIVLISSKNSQDLRLRAYRCMTHRIAEFKNRSLSACTNASHINWNLNLPHHVPHHDVKNLARYESTERGRRVLSCKALITAKQLLPSPHILLK